MKSLWFLILSVAISFFSCQSSTQTESVESDSTAVVMDEGVQMIPIQTPKGEFKVYTKRVGNNPTMKVLLLHGGPGMTHEQYTNFKDYFPQESIEFILYDQLGSAHSDQPDDSTLWTIERFVDEVEQVRIALGLDKNNFYL
jgi:proline iminopeptidase